MKSITYIDEAQIQNKRVLVRVDFNVTLKPNHHIADDTRIRQSIPTIQYLLNNNNKIILVSHLGRPNGIEASYSMKPVVEYLKKILELPVKLIDDFSIPEGNICMLENIRFYKEEKAGDVPFAKKLAGLADVYVNDAFGVSHRKDASVYAIAQLLPSYGGLLLKKEITHISSAIKNPKHPVVAIIGGAKLETKLGVIDKLLSIADHVLLGGIIAQHVSEIHPKHKEKLITPVDWVGEKMDIGPQTEAMWGSYIDRAKTIIWNGPVGYIEDPRYTRGTDFLYYAIAQNAGAISIIGGGDTLAAVSKKEYLDNITHISTGGGAMLEFIEFGTLPGLEALKR